MNEDKVNGATEGAEAQTAQPEDAPKLEERLAALEAELGESKDRLLRALAETENVRRRLEREREDAKRYGTSNFAKDLLNVADNLRRALESVQDAEIADPRIRSLVEGVAATERELLSVFERNGIRRVDPAAGDRFDHNLHQAMFEVPNTGREAGSIVQVLQPGYVIHDRLLRPAMVGVAKAEPGASEPRRVDEVV